MKIKCKQFLSKAAEKPENHLLMTGTPFTMINNFSGFSINLKQLICFMNCFVMNLNFSTRIPGGNFGTQSRLKLDRYNKL